MNCSFWRDYMARRGEQNNTRKGTNGGLDRLAGHRFVVANRLVERLVLGRVREDHALVADHPGALARVGEEAEVFTSEMPQVSCGIEDVHRGVDGRRVGGRPQERVELAGVGQHPAGRRLVENRLDHLLLVADPGEVAVLEGVPLAGVVEGLRAAHQLRTLVVVRRLARARVDRAVGGETFLYVDGYAAERVDDLLEAGEVDHDDVIDPYAGERLDRLYGQRHAAPRVRGVD